MTVASIQASLPSLATASCSIWQSAAACESIGPIIRSRRRAGKGNRAGCRNSLRHNGKTEGQGRTRGQVLQ